MKECRRYNIPGHAHELTFSCYNQQLFLNNDLTRNRLAEAIIKAKKKHQFDLWAYVFMPEHVHLLIWPVMERYSISDILQSIKQPIAKSTILHLKRHNPEMLALMATGKKRRPYHFWQPGGGYDRNITSRKVLLYSVDYIHNNPVRRGLVEDPGDWPWSSVRDWLGIGKSPVVVDTESFPGF